MQKPIVAGVGSEKIIRRRADGELEYQPDALTIEEPLEIRVNGKTLAITMRTPGQDEELAAGFLLSESIIRDADDVEDISRPNDFRNGKNIISVRLHPDREIDSGVAKRFGTITSSCGICGKESIAAVRQNFPPIISTDEVRIEFGTLTRLPELLRKGQSDFERT